MQTPSGREVRQGCLNIADGVANPVRQDPGKELLFTLNFLLSSFLMMNTESQGHYRTVLKVSLPLVISLSSTMIMEFTDRVFLANYSLDAIAAAMPAGLAALLFITFFVGIASYLNVFIAQYIGAGLYDRVGPAMWQGIYFSILAAFMLASLCFVAEPLFHISGHPPQVRQLEAVYFQVLLAGAGINVLGATLSSFYTGRGKTFPVMIIHIFGAVINIPLDYALINGVWIFPELGIFGAGIATVTSWAVVALLFVGIIFSKKNDSMYGVVKSRKFDKKIFSRLIKFGAPGSIQFSMDIFAFTVFIFMVGRIGTTELAVTSIILSIESLAFMPMMGISMGTSTLVAQALGRNRPDEAVGITKCTIHVVFFYLLALFFLFLLAPEWLINIFRPRDYTAEDYAAVVRLGIVLLRFVCAYIFFDALYMICIGVLKGAGDTLFISWSIGILSLSVMVLPLYISIEFFDAGLYVSWSFVTLFIFSLFLVSFWRFRQGKWKSMRVIGEC